MKSFHARLVICLRQAQMTTGDLRHWFARPYSTVERWIKDQREPRGPAGDEARRRLALLERGIALKKGFPIPANLPERDRPHHIEKLFNEHSSGVPRKNTASRRLQMRDGVQ